MRRGGRVTRLRVEEGRKGHNTEDSLDRISDTTVPQWPVAVKRVKVTKTVSFSAK